MSDKAIDILYRAGESNIEIGLAEDQLQLRLPKNTEVDKALLQQIKDNKQAIIDFLKKSSNQGKDVPRITKADRTQIKNLPLSFGQERLWFTDRLEGSVQYHMPAVIRLRGDLDKEALSGALKTIVQRHEAVRSIYIEKDDQVFQQVKDWKSWQLQVLDGNNLSGDEAALHKLKQDLIYEPFNLAKDYLFRATLIHLSHNEYILLVVMHHIASDGWSRTVLVKEIVELYSALHEHRAAQLPQISLQYADYAVWQRNYLRGKVLEQKIDYWKKNLEGTIPLQLPLDYVRPSVWTSKGSVEISHINKEQAGKLLELSRKNHATLFMTLMSLIKVLLYRLSGQHDICVGSPIAGRQQKELEGLIGFFVNTLALRSTVNGEQTFLELLRQVRNTTLNAYDNQDVPFERIVDELSIERDISRNPIFQVMFILMNTPEIPRFDIGGLELSREVSEVTSAKFDLQIQMTEVSDGLYLSVEYCTDLFKRDSILRFISYFKELITAVIEQPEQKVGQLNLLSEAEKSLLLHEYNGPVRNYPLNHNVVRQFEDHVAQTPDAVAAVFEDSVLTYAQLNKRANQLAWYLKSKGVTAEKSVPICLERSPEMLIGIWGVLKSGGAYVPVDPEYPADRISYMITDTGAGWVLCNRESASVPGNSGSFEKIVIDQLPEGENPEWDRNPDTEISQDQLAYIIYTSGSTGIPKGVMNQHNALANQMFWAQEFFPLTPEDAVLQKTTYCFDVSIWELIRPLTAGSRIVFAKPGGQKDPEYLKDLIDREQVTVAHFVSSMLGVFLPEVKPHECKSLKQVLCSGEALKLNHVQLFREKLPHVEMHNLYGPTEAAIHVTRWQAPQNIGQLEIVPIGKPSANTSMLILDENGQLAPIGGLGEIHIGGIQVARGYLNLPELTGEKFIPDPFSEIPGARLYRTGDVGRWSSDRDIEYMGRIDDQVKIRGFRVELGEVENAINRLPAVQESCVVLKQDTEGINKLVAYYIPDPGLVREKEGVLYPDRVANWKILYETEYEQTEVMDSVDAEFNIVGWVDSFTGNAISEQDMKGWVDEIVHTILKTGPKNVLEIGCGTGLIYFQLAGKVKKYIGTDFSATSVQQIRNQIQKGLKDYGPTELQVCAAHEVKVNRKDQIDTVVINSVVQYFPSQSYLTEVISNCISLLNGKGQIIIGDVRDLRLLPRFKERLQLQKMQNTAGIREFNWAVEQDLLNEEELCIAPEYFLSLKNKHPQISHIELLWKSVSFSNELSRYRYTAILSIGDETPPVHVDFNTWKLNQSAAEALDVMQKGSEYIAFKDVPNYRLVKEHNIAVAVSGATGLHVSDIVQASEHDDPEAEQISRLIAKAQEYGYRYKLYLDEDPFKINLVLHKKDIAISAESIYSEAKGPGGGETTNIPLFNDIRQVLQKEMKQMLDTSVPEYMIPSELIALRKIPITPNGKADKRFLSEREERLISKLNYQPPSGELQTDLVHIWEQLLGMDRIGVEDSFFDLGGHSLLVIRLISAMRSKLGIELAIKDVFLNPTISRLSAFIERSMEDNLSLPPVVKAESTEFIPLSFSQERLWFLDKMEGTVQYHLPTVLKLTGTPDIEALQRAFKSLVERHEAFRTVFREHKGQPCQVIIPADNWELTFTEWKGQSETPEAYLGRFIRNPFRLDTDYMIRAEIIRLDTNEHLLAVVLHHIASDAWSLSIMVKELIELYTAFCTHRTPELPELSLRYSDYAIWQRTHLKGEILARKLQFWRNKLKESEPLNLPLDFSRPAIQSKSGATLHFTLPKSTADKLNKLVQDQGSTLFMGLMAVFKAFLYRYTGQKDLCVGTSIAGREQKELEEMMGFFVNLLALRTQVEPEANFIQHLQKVKQNVLEAFEHQEVPFEKVVDAVVKERDMSRNPVFQVLLVLLNTPDSPKIEMEGVSLNRVSFENKSSKFDLTLLFNENTKGLQIGVEYCTALFKESTIQRLMANFEGFVNGILRDPLARIADYRYITDAEMKQVVEQFNPEPVPYPHNKTIAEVFDEVAGQKPDHIAIIYGTQQITYRRLMQESDRLAKYVKGTVNPGGKVSVLMDKTPEMMATVLGILKAGCAFVPVDKNYPADRIRFILEDTGSGLMITDEADQSFDTGTACRVVSYGAIKPETADRPLSAADLPGNPESVAYIMYTSGSTGKPKGVLVSNQNVVSLVCGVDYVHLSDSEILLSTGSPSFDATTFEYWSMLLHGGTLVLCKEETLLDTQRLKSEIHKHKVSMMWFTAGWFNQLVDADITLFEPLNTILAGGEKLSETHVQKLRNTYPHIRLVNGYGPTENTTFSIAYPIVETHISAPVPLGRPLNNRKAYVLDEYMQPVPIGVTGEIYLGGAGLSLGYLNRPELTSKQFVKVRLPNADYVTLYKTGDLGRWLENGLMEYAGRADDQVKIRGFRIEPGEIEQVISESGKVKQTVVVVHTDKEHTKRLIAYVVPDAGFDTDTLYRNLKNNLPDYMVPYRIIPLEALPLNQNGKVDRKALPEPEVSENREGVYQAPQSDTEKILAEIWMDLLDLDQVSVQDNFFEVGGDSLLAIRVIAAIRKSLEVEIPIAWLFEYQTIAEIASRIEAQSSVTLLPLIPKADPRPEKVPLSFSQERLWFIDKLMGSLQYHVPAVFRLHGALNSSALENAIRNVVSRHEVLRTVFREENGIPYQILITDKTWKLSFIDGSVHEGNKQAQQALIQSCIQKPFNLSEDFMLRAELIQCTESEHILVITQHHISSDGWSRSILAGEIVEGYNAELQNRPAKLPALDVQYADFSIWQKDYLSGTVYADKINYWKEKLSGVVPLELPSDFPRPAIQSTRGAVFNFKIDKKLSDRLQQISNDQGATLFMTLLSGFGILMHRYSGQTDICIGSPIAGRQQKEIEGLIGFFVNTLALRQKIDTDEGFISLLKQVKQTTLEAYEHQDMPFERIVEALVHDRDMSRSPLFQVMLVFQNTPDIPDLKLGDLILKGNEITYNTSLFDLNLALFENKEGISARLEYSTDLFSRETAARLAAHFVALLQSIADNPGEKISGLNVLPSEERNLLIHQFNQTEFPYEELGSVVKMLEVQVMKTPDRRALVFENKSFTYLELNEEINRLANFLIQQHGIKPGKQVGVMLNRSEWSPIAMMAVLKTGACYVPIDHDLPVNRIEYIVSDSQPVLILTHQPLYDRHNERIGVEWMNLDQNEWKLFPAHNPAMGIAPDSLSFIIYTSGSTGMPKGVMQTHRTLLNLVNWDNIRSGLGTQLNLLQYASYAFDSSLHDVCFSWSNGGCAFVLSEQTRMDYKSLADYIVKHKIEIVSMPFSALSGFIQAIDFDWLRGHSVRHIISTGEQLMVNKRFESFLEQNPGMILHNFYGPSETHVVTASSFVSNQPLPAHIPIGKPIDNSSVYIMDTHFNPSPILIPGEIYIGGDNLAAGYLNNEKMTGERFVPHFFHPGKLLYKSGDWGRWLPDGNIEYLGRIDEQVKIRGYRIELGEIENAVQLSGLVEQVAVVAQNDPLQGKRLVAYFVSGSNSEPQQIMASLREKLPEYMIPGLWVEMDALPLTLNGKIDKRALPEPELQHRAEEEYVAPEGSVELTLSEIWHELLGVSKISAHKNFFELGGHSLMAMRLVTAIRHKLNREIGVREIFLHPTIASLAKRINESASFDLLPKLVRAEPRPSDIPMSFAQERLWFIDQLEGSTQYHLPTILRLKGEININALDFALKQLAERHEVLRTVFVERQGNGFQHIIPSGGWKLETSDHPEFLEDTAALKKAIDGIVRKPFDMSSDYLFRAHLICIEPENSVLVVVLHHIVSDAWSISVIIREVMELYNSQVEHRAPVLPELAVQYADYALWQRDYLRGDVFNQKLNYWKQKLEGCEPLELPTDFNRPDARSYAGNFKGFKIDAETAEGLKALCQKEGVTLFMTMLAAYNVLLHKYSGQDDICVGTTIANRPQHELEGLIGFFVNTLSLRNEVRDEDTFINLLKQVKTTTLEAYQHQDMPFERVVEAVVKQRDTNRSPLFQVMLVFANTPESESLKLGNVQFSNEGYKSAISKFELTYHIHESPGGMQLTAEYSTELFSEETMVRMAGHFAALLKRIILNQEAEIGELDMMTDEEMEQMEGFTG